MPSGPNLIFDKSTLQSLNPDEAMWLDQFFSSNITPLFFLEVAERLRKFARHLVVLHGTMSARNRSAAREQLAAIPPDQERLVLATGRYVGEGFDDARLDTLFLALPVSWKGTLVQYAGRLHRLHPGKTEVRIFDYVDREMPMLRRMLRGACGATEPWATRAATRCSALPRKTTRLWSSTTSRTATNRNLAICPG